MEVGPLPEAECLTFRNHSGGYTLDAFAPLAHYIQRNHAGMTQSAWMQLSQSIVSSSGEAFVSPSMEAFYRVRCKETEIIPEWAGLMNAKSKDPVAMAELRAERMRKSKKQELVSKRRGLLGNKTPTERSVSPMFGEVQQVDPAVGSLFENDAAAWKSLSRVHLPLVGYPVIRELLMRAHSIVPVYRKWV